ncbi:VENN motif pre-toxin domain-containing protein [Proteus faecis]|uniref:VENN motif pre-toxin domain-containing protein n=1 Tax=Proteus faecis TaxID=2050967 RepID=UPI003075B278
MKQRQLLNRHLYIEGAVTAAQTGKNAVENNLMGGTEDGQVKFAQAHVSDMMSCSSNPSGDACIRGQAVDSALKLALVSGLGANALIVVADTAAADCLTNPVLCANEVGTFIIETLGAEAAPAGIAITGTAGVTAKLTKEQLVELASLQAVAKKDGVEVTPEIVNKVITGKGTSGSAGAEQANNAANNALPNVDQLSQAAASANRNGLTDAGRALQKHGGREGSVYTYTDQKAATLNKEAQNIVNDILTTPGTKIESRYITENKQRIKVIEATAPDGRALRFNEDGSKLIGFREP